MNSWLQICATETDDLRKRRAAIVGREHTHVEAADGRRLGRLHLEFPVPFTPAERAPTIALTWRGESRDARFGQHILGEPARQRALAPRTECLHLHRGGARQREQCEREYEQ